MARPLEELLSDEDYWPRLEAQAAEGANDVELIPASREDGARALEALQVTTRSPLGSIAYHVDHGLVDGGWVRLLGARGDRERMDWGTGLVVGHDAVGGFFAINGGGLPGEQGEVRYLAPDTLRWEPTGRGFGEWLGWLFDADLGSFYEDLRWPGWEAEVRDLSFDRAIHLYPFPFTEEGSDVAEVSRRPVPLDELWTQAMDFRERLAIEDDA